MTKQKTDAETLALVKLVGDLPDGLSLTEGSVIPLRDFGGTTVWLRIQRIFDSPAMGPAVTGHQYGTQEAAENTIDKHYMGTRSLPLSAVVDIEGDKAQKKAHTTAVRQRRTGGGICLHCGETTGGGCLQLALTSKAPVTNSSRRAMVLSTCSER